MARQPVNLNNQNNDLDTLFGTSNFNGRDSSNNLVASNSRSNPRGQTLETIKDQNNRLLDLSLAGPSSNLTTMTNTGSETNILDACARSRGSEEQQDTLLNISDKSTSLISGKKMGTVYLEG